MKNVIMNITVSATNHAKGDYSSFINILRKLATTNRMLIRMSHKKQNIEPSYGNANVWKKNTDHFLKLQICSNREAPASIC